LKYLIDNLAGGKHTLFAKKCGIPPGTFQAYVDTGTIPRGEQLAKIASAYRINLNWLLLGEGQPFWKTEDGALSGPALRLLEELEQATGVSLIQETRQTLIQLLDRAIQEVLAEKREAVEKLMISFWGGKEITE
jgi:hypothetical protein